MRGDTPAQPPSPQSSTHQTPKSSRMPSPALSKSSAKSGVSASGKEMQTDKAEVKPGVMVNVCKPAPPKPTPLPPENDPPDAPKDAPAGAPSPRPAAAGAQTAVGDPDVKIRDLEAQVEVLQKSLEAVQAECSEQTAMNEALHTRLEELQRSVQSDGALLLHHEKSEPDVERVRSTATDLEPIDITKQILWDAHFARVDAFFMASCRR